ncbi:MAG: tetratricopeptide repeat protein [Planctomycetes bacterium]|nr:tetratricopeptide repeat protein [Planctomycetota bacterium]
MSEPIFRVALLERIYHGYLVDQDATSFMRQVSAKYVPATLERLLQFGPRLTRRAAALAIGLLGDYRSNAPLGQALHDEDRGVRTLAENSLRTVWCRDGSESQRGLLEQVIRLNSAQNYRDANQRATELIDQCASFAEAWNQRAISHYGQARYVESIHDCRQAAELNPFHFGAVAGLGQCYLQLGNQLWALESFRRALELNPDLEGIRAQVNALERRLKQN